MQKKFLLVLFLFLCGLIKSQHVEVGVFAGTTYYLGELNPGTPIVNKPRPVIGVAYRKNWSKRYALRLGANYGKLASSDQVNSSEWSKFRTLSFSSTIIEASGMLEFNFLPYQINNYNTSPFTPYVYIGAAAFYVKPKIKNNQSDDEVKASSLIAPSIPFGFGLKFNFYRNLGVAIDWGMRKTYTDKIDGLDETYINGYQLSNSLNNDWYSFLGVSLNYKILTKRDRCPVAK